MNYSNMKKYTALLAAGFAMALPLAAQSKTDLMLEAPKVMDDPEWQKRFLGSYGFMPSLEPKVNQEEIVVLGDLIEIMKADPDAAAEQLKLKINDSSSAALIFILGNLYFQQGKLEEAQKYYLMAIEKHPSFLRAHKNIGLLYLQDQDFANAQKHLGRASELGEHDGRTNGLIGYAYLSTDNYLAAEEAYRDAIQQEPDVIDWQLGLARTLLATERYNEAVSLFDTLIKLQPDNSMLWMLQANAYLGQGKPMEAAINLEAVRSLGTAKRESLLLLGDIYLNMEMPEAALEVYESAIGNDKTSAGYPSAIRAARLLQQIGAAQESTELLEKVKTQYAGMLTTEQELTVLTLQAKNARSLGDEAQAITILKDIVKRDGTNGEALIELADFYSKSAEAADLERAIYYIELAEAIEEFEYQALVKHAQMLANKRKYHDAIILLKRALSIKEEPRIERYLAQLERAVNR